MTPTATESSCILVSFSPSSGIGVYVEQEEWHEFDLVSEEDEVMSSPAMQHMQEVRVMALFESREELQAFATKEYLRDKKNGYYSTLLTQRVGEALREDVLRFLDDAELVRIPVAPDLVELLCEIGSRKLARGALRQASSLRATNVLDCLRREFRPLIEARWGPETFPPRLPGVVPSRGVAAIIRPDRPHIQAPHWVGLRTRVPQGEPNQAEYVAALVGGSAEVREHFSMHFAPRLQRQVVPEFAYIAEDLVQSALMESLRSLDERGLRDPRSLAALTSKVLKSVTVEARRRERYIPLGDSLLAPMDEATEQLVTRGAALQRSQPSVAPEVRSDLHAALDELRERNPLGGTILMLRSEDWTLREIAEELGLSVASAYRQLVRARTWMREQLSGAISNATMGKDN